MKRQKLSAGAILSRSKNGKRFALTTKHNAAIELGRSGGLIGGPARAKKLSAKQTREIAIHAANMRWGNKCNCSYC